MSDIAVKATVGPHGRQRSQRVDTSDTKQASKAKTGGILSRTARGWRGMPAHLAGCGAAVLVVYILCDLTFSRTIDFEPIAVPKALADSGFGPDVAAQRLRDALTNLTEGTAEIGQARSGSRAYESAEESGFPLGNTIFRWQGSRKQSKKSEAVRSKHMAEEARQGTRKDRQVAKNIFLAKLTTAVVPGVGVSVGSIVVALQNFFDITDRHKTVSGEFTKIDNHLGLIVRVDGSIVFPKNADAAISAQAGSNPSGDVEALLDQAAAALVVNLKPGLPRLKDHYVAQVQFNLGNALYAHGAFKEAIDAYQDAVNAADHDLDKTPFPDKADLHNNLGNALYEQGYLRGAIDQYREAISLCGDPAIAAYCRFHNNLGRFHNNLGAALYEQGRASFDQKTIDDAIKEYRTATDLDRSVGVFWNDLGNALYDRHDLATRSDAGPRSDPQRGRDLDEAINAYTQAVVDNPGNPGFLDDLGAAHYRNGEELDDPNEDEQATGEFEKAADAYRRAIGLAPENALFHADLADALYGLRKSDEAIREYRAAARLAPENTRFHIDLADALYGLGRFDEAIREYREATHLAPRNALLHADLADALYELKKVDEAIKEYHEAIQLRPKSARFHYDLGKALYEQGKRDEAIDQYRAARDCEPDNPLIQDLLDKALSDKQRPGGPGHSHPLTVKTSSVRPLSVAGHRYAGYERQPTTDGLLVHWFKSIFRPVGGG